MTLKKDSTVIDEIILEEGILTLNQDILSLKNG